MVALSSGWVDATLELGVVPVAANRWSSTDAPFAPWNADVLKEPTTTPINTVADISVEEIAKLRPDVIFGSYAVTSNKGLYAALSKIAPTIGIIGKDNQDGTLAGDPPYRRQGPGQGRRGRSRRRQERGPAFGGGRRVSRPWGQDGAVCGPAPAWHRHGGGQAQ
ncbi:ABC transporter substrate-binding protein [Spongiactinospora sp. 9N601]|uniref:ABC transporter substrate-binding protein n=1 Tax=Spongiactinospora sp. 9N601 TaxID=3375149 RepID=UPI0037973F15